MSESLRWNGIRISTALFATLAVVSLGVRADVAWADEPGGEDIVVPPPAQPPEPPPPPPPSPPPPADEDNTDLYLSGNVGGSFGKGRSKGNIGIFPAFGNDEEEDVFGGGALGIHYHAVSVGVRVEIEGQAARGYDLTTGWGLPVFPLPLGTEVNTWAMFGNIWLDFPITESVSVFGGGGLGFAVTDMTTNLFGGFEGKARDETKFAWQAGGGVTIAPMDWLAFDLGYRFIDLGEPDLKIGWLPLSNVEMHLQSHDVVLGVRMDFFSF
jgi:opacity protein-like surface antigen